VAGVERSLDDVRADEARASGHQEHAVQPRLPTEGWEWRSAPRNGTGPDPCLPSAPCQTWSFRCSTRPLPCPGC
jgi:hypothetical protein